MKLSFVIPAYNEEKMLAACLESIMKQTKSRNDTEIIVVNNTSTDRTRNVALSFKGVTVIDEPEKGLVKARRAGFLASTGDLIANVDADTILTPHWVEKVLRAFYKSEKLVAISGPYVYYDLSPFSRLLVKLFYGLGYCIYLVDRFILRSGSMLQGGNFVVRRSALEAIGGYNPTHFDFYGEDTDLARRLQKVGGVKFTFALPMYSSGRRLAEEGMVKTGTRYALNHVWTLVFKKPFTKSSIDVRVK